MGSIRLVYPHRLQAITGHSEEIVKTLTPSSVRDLITYLTERYGERFKEEMNLKSLELGETTPFYLVLVDGRRIPESGNSEAVIEDGAEVAFLPIFSGG